MPAPEFCTNTSNARHDMLNVSEGEQSSCSDTPPCWDTLAHSLGHVNQILLKLELHSDGVQMRENLCKNRRGFLVWLCR